MSRIAKKPISVPKLVTIEILDSLINVRGSLGVLSLEPPPEVSVTFEKDLLKVVPLKADSRTRAQAGTLRARLYNQVRGVHEGFSVTLVLVKVGANAKIEDNYLVLKIGYSNPKRYCIPKDITVKTPSATEVVISGIDIQKVYQVAAEIIKIRPPEVYKGTGILMKGQRIQLKAAKKK